MGESRTELLAWLNDLLQLNYTKIEQAGSGAAYAQIMDSIYGDVHMNKLKFDTKHEYEYINNFKVLQHTFNKHKIDKVVPVDKLIKCKFQDNLEFMQWVKRFWEQNFPGGAYDAVARRKGGTSASKGTSGLRASAPTRRPAGGLTTGTSVRSTSRNASERTPSGSTSSGTHDNHSASVIIDLQKELANLKLTVDGLEKEREFYFNKLRDIEILVQEELEAAENGPEHIELPILKDIQTILYSTEDGFEVPVENDGIPDQHGHTGQDDFDDETY